MAEAKQKQQPGPNRQERRAAERKARAAERAEHGARKTRKRRLQERRFDAPPLSSTPLAVAGGALGALALGAGVHGQLIRTEPLSFAPYLVAGGAAALLAALVLGDSAAYPVRVGDGGVAVERRGEVSRLLWCDVDAVLLQGNDLVIKSADLVLRIPVKQHAAAVAWIVKEVGERLPDLLKLSSAERASLPSAPTATYERLPIEGLQLTGRACASSQLTISLERDARLCPNCGQVYHRLHVPSVCSSCDQPVGATALSMGDV
jgi:hypothetical protein